MPSHHFCCCLPLRLGVTLISLLQFVFTGALGGLLWWVLIERPKSLDAKLRSATISLALAASIFCITCFIGLIGALRAKFSYIKTYAMALGGLFGIQIVLSMIYLWAFFTTNKTQLMNDCTDGSTDQNVINACSSEVNMSKGGAVAAILVPLVVSFYGLWIVYSYGRQLEDRDARRDMMMSSSSGFSYKPVNNADEATKPLTQPDVMYPYADGAHSYGNTAYQPYQSSVPPV